MEPTKINTTTMGHMHKVSLNIYTTKVVTPDEIMKKENNHPSKEYLPPRKIKNSEHIVQITAVKFEDLKSIMSTDQTGAFPITLAQGN